MSKYIFSTATVLLYSLLSYVYTSEILKMGVASITLNSSPSFFIEELNENTSKDSGNIIRSKRMIQPEPIYDMGTEDHKWNPLFELFDSSVKQAKDKVKKLSDEKIDKAVSYYKEVLINIYGKILKYDSSKRSKIKEFLYKEILNEKSEVYSMIQRIGCYEKFFEVFKQVSDSQSKINIAAIGSENLTQNLAHSALEKLISWEKALKVQVLKALNASASCRQKLNKSKNKLSTKLAAQISRIHSFKQRSHGAFFYILTNFNRQKFKDFYEQEIIECFYLPNCYDCDMLVDEFLKILVEKMNKSIFI